jgi:phosphomannomutase
MGEELIITISGMRGIVGENLTAAIASEYGSAFGTFLKEAVCRGDGKPAVCIGRDSRISGQMLTFAVTAGLCAVGVDVVDLGLVITPSAGVMVRELRCSGGVIITASHNPIQYNGIKLLLNNGMAPPVTAAEQIKRHFLNKDFAFVDSVDCGLVVTNDWADSVHIARILAIVDKQVIIKKNFRVVLDSVNGAGGRVTKRLLSELGCRVCAMNDEPTGLFAHEPEPTAVNLKGLSVAVKDKGADIGFAQDPDGDRLAIVDQTGRYIGEEYTLALTAKYVFGKKKGKAATNLSTSRMIDDIAKNAGCEVIRAPVGEANVASAMLENNCIIGGEGNGGVIDLRVGPIRDSLVGIAMILQLMAETGKTISELVNEIGSYYMCKEKFTADSEQVQQILELARRHFVDARLNTQDGYRFDFNDGWVHLRASNTEPIMRVIVEAKDENAARKYSEAVMKIRDEVLRAAR